MKKICGLSWSLIHTQKYIPVVRSRAFRKLLIVYHAMGMHKSNIIRSFAAPDLAGLLLRAKGCFM